jgi:putative transposase
LDISINEKRSLIEAESEILTISRQCELLSLARSSFYYEAASDSEKNLQLMRVIDELYTRTPFYGRPRLTEQLKKLGHNVNHKRVGRLMRKMGLEAIYPRPKLSLASSGHKIYPYLLRGVEIRRNNQVWSTDITYIRLRQGFIYLVAILDWYSRYVLAWEISNTMDVSFCLVALERALRQAHPEIFNSDQGSQFTSKEFTGRLEVADIRISMDGRGRVFDNIFIERLWRSVKYEAVYLHDYENVTAAIRGLARYFQFYNQERLHQALDYKTPAQVYFALAV